MSLGFLVFQFFSCSYLFAAVVDLHVLLGLLPVQEFYRNWLKILQNDSETQERRFYIR